MDGRSVSPQGDAQEALVRSARAGDRPALDQLAGQYRASLLAVAFMRTSDMEAAEDLVQEVLTRAWQKLLVNPGGPPLPADWAELSDYQKTVLRVLFCETFGLLLVSGLPILQALDLLAELLPIGQREGLRAVWEAVRAGDRLTPGLERLGILPSFAGEMIGLGEDTGSLDRALERAADAFQHELECRTLLEGQ